MPHAAVGRQRVQRVVAAQRAETKKCACVCVCVLGGAAIAGLGAGKREVPERGARAGCSFHAPVDVEAHRLRRLPGGQHLRGTPERGGASLKQNVSALYFIISMKTIFFFASKDVIAWEILGQVGAPARWACGESRAARARRRWRRSCRAAADGLRSRRGARSTKMRQGPDKSRAARECRRRAVAADSGPQANAPARPLNFARTGPTAHSREAGSAAAEAPSAAAAATRSRSGRCEALAWPLRTVCNSAARC